ncbi:hypothetical protein FRB96_000792 [Tulasnella sp. 330]|nr:hypothetical protein FRB96_000792 [Tulasnella sp. 330]KAG8882519.1 hypothetical protein FRB97_008145 [Tulasnella sp. 331]KAG8888853.1 hypothetical protein FRB98_006639 [Tulasnella sp. 332]
MRDDRVISGHTGTFVFLALLSGVTAAISTWLLTKWGKHHNQGGSIKSSTGFICFTAWLSLLLSIIYASVFRMRPNSSVVNVGSHLGWLVLLWIFWTAGAAAITAALSGGHNCSTINYQLPYCNQLNAELGFAWASWIITTIALIVIIIFGIKSTKRGEGWRGGLV